MRPTLEIIALTGADCQAAKHGGADRIELCSAMALGGLTPSIGTAVAALRQCTLPIMAMVRPRSGGFCYTPSEFEAMEHDVIAFRELGLAGVVFGVLLPSGEVDLVRNSRLVEAAGSMQTVFHRAFDRVPDPQLALAQLIDLGFTRVLTSGQQKTALEGSDLIASLIQLAGSRIEVLPGSGIRPHNVKEILAATGANQVHASAFKTAIDTSGPSGAVSFNAGGASDQEYNLVSVEAVRALAEAVVQ